MSFTAWPDVLPLVQSALNNAPSPQRANISPITAFLGRDPTPPIGKFIRSSVVTPVTIEKLQLEKSLNIESLKTRVAELHPQIQNTIQANREQSREYARKGVLPDLTDGDYVLVAREGFFPGERLALRWRGPRRIVKPKTISLLLSKTYGPV